MIISARDGLKDHQMTEELLLRMVVDVVSSDYEDYPTLLEEVTNWAKDEQLDCSNNQVAHVLRLAVENGLIQAFTYNNVADRFDLSPIEHGTLTEKYFAATSKGRDMLNHGYSGQAGADHE